MQNQSASASRTTIPHSHGRRVVALAFGLVFCVATVGAAQDARLRQFAGVWRAVKGYGVDGKFYLLTSPFPGNPPFTAAGGQAFRALDRSKDPVAERCWPPGPTRFMPEDSAVPIEIIPTRTGLAILNPSHSIARRIYTDGRRHPTDWDHRTFMGHSIGRWDRDTLVVETTLLNDKTWLTRGGLPHSDQMRLIERMTLRRPYSAATRPDLEVLLSVQDPRFYREPLRAIRWYSGGPGGGEVPPPDDSCLDALAKRLAPR